MNYTDTLRTYLVKLLDWQEAHLSFEATVEGIPSELQGAQPAGLPYSPWQILEHIRFTQHDILDFCRNPKYIEPEPGEYWPPTSSPPDAVAWNKSIAGFRSDLDELRKLAADNKLDPFAAIPHGTGQTYLREFLLVADHNAYHIGQLIVLRRLLGIWK